MTANVGNENIGKVGFVMNSTAHHLVDSHEFISPRLTIRHRIKDQDVIFMINGYTPISAAKDEERNEFYQFLEEAVRAERSYYRFVVSDFNAIIGTNCNGDWKFAIHGCTSMNDNGEQLLDFLSACRLFHANPSLRPAKPQTF